MAKSKAKAKKQVKAGVDYPKAIGLGLVGLGLMMIILLLVAILAKGIQRDKQYVISYRSDDKLAEEIVNKSELNGTVVEVDEEVVAADTSNYITVEKALDLALANAGLKREQVWDIDVELERKFGQVVFEVSFDAGQYEYEIYINAESGEIVKSFKEIN